MQIDLPDGMRRADQGDIRNLARITADAFSEDPVMRWMLGPERAMESVFRVLGRSLYQPDGGAFLLRDQGAAMWRPWGCEREPSSLDMLSLALGQMRFGAKGSLSRAVGASEIMERNHPKDRHWYLFTIGARKSARGQGVGKTLLQPVLKACDREQMPVYLENSNPVNSGFYRAHGFERLGEPFQVGEGSPVMEPMWREPN